MPNTESSKVNLCIQTLTGDTSWRGSVIAFAKNPEEEHVDIGTPVFSRILDAFRGVRGVRINCDGVVQAQNAPRFESVMVKSHDLKGVADDYRSDRPRDHTASLLTQHTGIVLQNRRDYSSDGYPQNSHLDQRNSTARLLLIPCNINKSNFGHYMRPSDTGNIIVIREDRQPLDVEYVQILCEWLSKDLLPRFKKARVNCVLTDHFATSVDDSTSQKRAIRQWVFERITKQDLLAYSRGRLKDEGITEDEEVEDVVENQDTTDEDMPDIEEESEASDGDEDEL
jgi:hypothetical protein